MIPLLISCEHATCAVPDANRELFRNEEELLTSPDGWDPGALNLAQALAMKFRTQLVHGEITKLLIDLHATHENRRWSRFGKLLTDAQRARMAERHLATYMAALHQRVTDETKRSGKILHISVHTFPSNEAVSLIEAHVALGYDPTNEVASGVARRWAKAFRACAPDLSMEMNPAAPLVDLGVTTVLASQHRGSGYGGLVLEVAQTFFLEGKPWRWDKLKKALLDSLVPALEDGE
jgi:predicted N-formylglutamate amidohydrolase